MNNIFTKRMMVEGRMKRSTEGASGSFGFSSKGQVSLEIMIYVIILTLMLAIVSYAAMTRSNSIMDEKVNMDARRVAKLLAIEINTAVSVGDGYQNSFLLPQSLYGRIDYTITIIPESQRLYIDWGSRSYNVPLLTCNITGTSKKGINLIKNDKGLITLE